MARPQGGGGGLTTGVIGLSWACELNGLCLSDFKSLGKSAELPKVESPGLALGSTLILTLGALGSVWGVAWPQGDAEAKFGVCIVGGVGTGRFNGDAIGEIGGIGI